MSIKIGSAVYSGLAAGFVISLGVALGASGATAASRRYVVVAAHSVHRLHAAHPWHYFANRIVPSKGYVDALPPGAIVEPGYVFVPGRGILGESCNMPTSTCSNEYRDIQ